MNVSVVITTFNREPVLRRALDSVLAQTTPPAEVIVVDDGSTDSTGTTVKSSYKDVVYFYQSSQGVSSARNAGIEIATSDWIAFLDSDDAWLPSKLVSQIKALANESGLKFCHTNEIWIRNNVRVNQKLKHQKFGGWIYRKCLPMCVISPSSVLIHRSVLEHIGCFDERLPACEDYDLWLRICAHYPVLYLSEPLITKYGGHTDQLSRRYWGMDRFRVTALEKMMSCGSLAHGDRAATVEILLNKIRVVLTGARKRGNDELIREYSAKIQRYTRLREGCGIVANG